MKSLIVALTLMSLHAVAAPNCDKQITAALNKAQAGNELDSITFKKTLKPGDEIWYKNYDIPNSKNYPVDAYIVKSSYMAGFTHLAFVKNPGCKVVDFIEVDFE